MPRTKLDPPKYPPVDWLLAGILERKKTMGLTWDDIGVMCGTTGENMRQFVRKKPPMEWPKSLRETLCKKLGLEIKVYVVGSPEDVSNGQ